jgi:hypothetical protein
MNPAKITALALCFVFLASFGQAYCSSSSSTYTYDQITMVALNTGNQTSTGNNYTDYSTSTFTTLAKGQAYK